MTEKDAGSATVSANSGFMHMVKYRLDVDALMTVDVAAEMTVGNGFVGAGTGSVGAGMAKAVLDDTGDDDDALVMISDKLSVCDEWDVSRGYSHD